MNLTVNSRLTPPAVSPNFQKSYRKVLIEMPNVPCACCGQTTFAPQLFAKACATIVRPLTAMLQTKSLSPKSIAPEILKCLNLLAQRHPKDSLDKILENKEEFAELRTAIYSSIDEKTDTNFGKTLQDIRNRSRSNLRSSSLVMRRLAGFKKYLSGPKLETFEQLEIYAQKYPRKTLSEIINMPEIYQFHRTKDLLQRAQTNEKRQFHFNNIRNLIKKANPDAVEYFEEIKEKVIDIFANTSDDNRRIYLAKQIYRQALKEKGCEKIESKVLKELEQIPRTYITSDSFLAFAKNHDYPDIVIIESLLNPSMSSFEHIVPKSKNGSNFIENGIVLCRRCNTNRGDIPYPEFAQYHPEMSYNAQKQLNYISRFILNGDFADVFDLWPIHVARTLSQESNGAIQLDTSRYCKSKVKKAENLIKSRQKVINDLEQEKEANSQKREELRRQLAELDSEAKTLNENISSLNRANRSETKKTNIFKEKSQ